MCDIEFTIEDGQLWMLQVRVGKRSPAAAFRIAVDLVDEGRIDLDEALRRVDGTQLQSLLHPQFAATVGAEVLGRGLAASPGAAVGEVVLDAATATAWADSRTRGVLVRPETSADDVAGMIAAAAVVTARGGLTSHAAVVARGLGRTCVSGVAGLEVDVAVRRGTWPGGASPLGRGHVSVDGSTGTIYRGRLTVRPSDVAAALQERGEDTAPRSPTVAAVRRVYATPTVGAYSASARTPKPAPRRPGWRGSTAPTASGFAGPSTCSSATDASWSRTSSSTSTAEPLSTTSPRRPGPELAVGATSHGRRPGCGPTSRPAAARVPART